MKFIQKLFAGLLLSFGSLFLLVGIVETLGYNPQGTPKEQERKLSGILGCYSIGTIISAGGGFIVWDLHQKQQKQLKESLDSTFYRLLKAGSGQITILQLAMEAQISGDQAKKYLDQRAKEFNASFEPREAGNINYLFDI